MINKKWDELQEEMKRFEKHIHDLDISNLDDNQKVLHNKLLAKLDDVMESGLEFEKCLPKSDSAQ